MTAPEQRMRELRVGMSVFWVRLVREGEGWCATWTQKDQTREVWCRGDIHAVMVEARLLARKLDSPSVPDTEPNLPEAAR